MGILKNVSLGALGGTAAYVTWKAAKTAEAQCNAALASGKKIVIVGAGFAGSAVAAELARLLPEDGNGEVTLIDEDDFLLFTPMLTEVAGGELDPRHVAVPLRKLPKRINVVRGAVKKIDTATKTITVTSDSNATGSSEVEFRADHLVIAVGSVTNFHDVPGVAEHGLGLKRLQDAATVCSRVLHCLELAANERDTDRRKALLTFVVAGGGYTGVETMAALNDLVRETAPEYKIPAGEIRTIIVNPEERLLSETSKELAKYATAKLEERGVEVRMKTSVKKASADEVEFNSGEHVPTHTLVWAAGVKPNPIVSDLDCEKGKHGGLKVNGYCQIAGRPGMWALGDCAEIPKPDSTNSETYAPTAQNATREGALVARNIIRELKGLSAKPFIYKPIGELALVGKHAGVARVWGQNFSGLCAWAMWRAVYLAKMPGTAQKVRVVSDWTLDLLFGRDPVGWRSRSVASSATQSKAAQTA